MAPSSSLIRALIPNCGFRYPKIAQSLPPEKIDLRPEFVPLSELHELLGRAHVVAGVFGTSEPADGDEIIPPLELDDGEEVVALGYPGARSDTAAPAASPSATPTLPSSRS